MKSLVIILVAIFSIASCTSTSNYGRRELSSIKENNNDDEFIRCNLTWNNDANEDQAVIGQNKTSNQNFIQESIPTAGTTEKYCTKVDTNNENMKYINWKIDNAWYLNINSLKRRVSIKILSQFNDQDYFMKAASKLVMKDKGVRSFEEGSNIRVKMQNDHFETYCSISTNKCKEVDKNFKIQRGLK